MIICIIVIEIFLLRIIILTTALYIYMIAHHWNTDGNELYEGDKRKTKQWESSSIRDW